MGNVDFKQRRKALDAMAKAKSRASEAEIHVSIINWAAWKLSERVIVHHSPNEGKRGWKAQAAVKSHGVAKGFPDLVFLCDGRAYFMEVKTATGKVSPEQEIMMDRLREQGFDVALVRSLEEAEEWFKVWGLLKVSTRRNNQR